MKKIVLVANTDWYLYNFRRALAQRLRDAGWTVVLVSPPGPFADRLRRMGFDWRPWAVGRKTTGLLGEARALLGLLALYRRERPDLVHHFTIKPVLYGSLAAGLARVPRVVNAITGLGYVFLQNDRQARLIRGLITRVYRWLLWRPNTRVIFENANDRAFFLARRLVRAETSYLIEGVGVDTDYFAPTPEPDGIPLAVQAGRLLWDKGVGDLAEAARILRRRGVAVQVVLVGEPDPGNPASVERETLDGWVRDGVLEWWGFQEDIRAVYQRSHIAVLASLGEGLPTALVEAAACARPVVATDVAGCRSAVIDGQTGILAPARDPEGLADALQRLAEDAGLRRRMGEAGRRLVEERFAQDLVLDQTLAVYES